MVRDSLQVDSVCSRQKKESLISLAYALAETTCRGCYSSGFFCRPDPSFTLTIASVVAEGSRVICWLRVALWDRQTTPLKALFVYPLEDRSVLQSDGS